MRPFFLSIVLGTLSLGAYAQSFDFYRYSPAAKTIKGVQYPRNHMTLYRGTTDGQMSLEKATRAMFRDPTANVESFFFSTIKHRLMGKSGSGDIQLSSYLMGEVKRAVEENGGDLDEKAAVVKAQELSDDTFEYYGDKKNISQYVDYNSGSWVDWPKDVVFATVVSPAAATYGDKIIIMNEKTPRALDLNYGNLEKNGKDRDHDRDIGEFSTPGYILYSDVDGYEIRTGVKGPVVNAFHRIEIGGETFILVMDGTWSDKTLSKCIVRTGDFEIVHCNYGGGFAMTPPPATDKAVAIQGIVALCSSRASCKVPKEIYQNFTLISSKKLSSETQQKLENVSLNGKKAFFIPAQ